LLTTPGDADHGAAVPFSNPVLLWPEQVIETWCVDAEAGRAPAVAGSQQTTPAIAPNTANRRRPSAIAAPLEHP
jgi:hypothetical protein